MENMSGADEIGPALNRAQREVDRGSVVLGNVKTDDPRSSNHGYVHGTQCRSTTLLTHQFQLTEARSLRTPYECNC
jgi:hypothetical protein